jgi:hypothetical protein
MANLKKGTLSYNDDKGKWDLKEDKTDKLIQSFKTKEDATKGGALEKALGKEGGSVKIQKKDGKIQEERTYPGNKDPKKSRG